MKNDKRNFFSPDLELFNGGSWGVALYWPMKLIDLPQFWKKDTFSRLHEGRSWGGGWGGAEMEGRMGGRLLAYMGGRWGGVPIAPKAFFNSKIAIF